jgi:hypothetical protein
MTRPEKGLRTPRVWPALGSGLVLSVVFNLVLLIFRR